MLATALHTLQFTAFDDDADDGLVSVRGDANIRIDEALVIRDAAAFEHVSHVYFRRFDDGRSSQPVAFIVDNHDERLDESRLAILHKELWLHGVTPLVYIVWPTRVDILTCARGSDFWDRKLDRPIYNPIEQIEIASHIEAALVARRRFSAPALANGTFWDDPQNADFAAHDETAHETLIQNIVDADRELDGANKPILRRLLLLSVLIKYLEDRQVFPSPGWFGRFHPGARTFFQVLGHAEPDGVLRLLGTLERKFNGDVFSLPEGAEQQLTRRVLRELALLVDARTRGSQRYLWAQHSFRHLPVEVISHLYQRFVHGHGAVYTPPHLASLLLDYAMPYDRLRGGERVLDPACGSGVFLVGAFRRLVTVWRSHNGWRQPDASTLQDILRSSIFGVELDATAVDLTAFSLSLAVCDALQSNVIWRDLRFVPLRGTNLICGDFFDHELGPFDVIVGNPPFESRLSPGGRRVNERAVAQRGRLPDQQAAYLFLEQGLEALADEARICLIQPAGFLYNRKAARFCQRVLKRTRVSAILDFASIRHLFDGADPKAVAVLADNAKPTPDHEIVHLTFRRTFAAHQRIGFEIDHYDRHRVPQPVAESDRLIWRANLLGGGRLAALGARMRSMRTLGEFVTEQGWLSGEGFIVGKRTHEAPFLTGKRLLPTSALTVDGIDRAQLDEVREQRFEKPRRAELFRGPLVVIREHASLPAAFWERGELAYKDTIVGIHAPVDASGLAAFFESFHSRRRQYRFCCALNGSKALIGKATVILKGDIESLPYPDDDRELELAFWEAALQDDVLDYMVPYVRLGQNSELLRRPTGPEQLSAYSELFCQLLGSVYDNLRSADPVFLHGLICQPFYFGDAPEVEWLGPQSERHLRRLIFHEVSQTLRTIRVVRFYEHNAMLVVKPDRLRYWIRSTAIRDADDTLVDLHEQGY